MSSNPAVHGGKNRRVPWHQTVAMLAGWASWWLLALYFLVPFPLVLYESKYPECLPGSKHFRETWLLHHPRYAHARYSWEWTALWRKQPGRRHPEKSGLEKGIRRIQYPITRPASQKNAHFSRVWSSHLVIFSVQLDFPFSPGLAPGGHSQNATQFSGMKMILNSVSDEP